MAGRENIRENRQRTTNYRSLKPMEMKTIEQEEDIDAMLREIAALLVQSQELLDKLP